MNGKPTPSFFAKRLRDLLFEMNISLTDLERANVCSQNAARKYIACERIPRADVLQRLCALLNVSSDYLLGLSDIKGLQNKWIFVDGECRCSHCGGRGETTFEWCPNCGEKMNVLL